MANIWAQGGHQSGVGGAYSKSMPKGQPPPTCFFCSGPHFVVECPTQRAQGRQHQPAPSFPGPSNPVHNAPQGGQWGYNQYGGEANPYGTFQPIEGPSYGPSQTQQYGNGGGHYGPQNAQHPYPQYGNSPAPYDPASNGYSFQQSIPAMSSQPNYSTPTPYHGPQPAIFPDTTHHQGEPNREIHTGAHFNGGTYPGPSPASTWNSTQFSNTASPYQHQQMMPRNDNLARHHSAQSNKQTQSPQTYGPVGSHPSSNNAPQAHDPPKPKSTSLQSNGFCKGNVIVDGEASGDDAAMELATPSAESSRASTPFGRYGENDDATNPSVTGKHTVSEKAGEEEVDGDEQETGSNPPRVQQDSNFNWEYKKIFMEQKPSKDIVELAQPLAAMLTSRVTPVPLLQPRPDVSVSRYARVGNLEEFLKDIRSQPQWSYLQEDPGFLSPVPDRQTILIPFADVRYYMAENHDDGDALPESFLTSGNFRHYGYYEDDDVQEDVDNQLQYEAIPYGQAALEERDRREGIEEDTVIVQSVNADGEPVTPTLGIAGTLSPIDKDSVWAPQPGEGAPSDPTEALLASLGVTGSPKPVRALSPMPSHHRGLSEAPSHGHVMIGQSPASKHSPSVPPPVNPLLNGRTPHQNMPNTNQYGYGGPPPTSVYDGQQHHSQGQYLNSMRPQPGNQQPGSQYAQHGFQTHVPAQNDFRPGYQQQGGSQYSSQYSSHQYGPQQGFPPQPSGQNGSQPFHRQESYLNGNQGLHQFPNGAPAPRPFPSSRHNSSPFNSGSFQQSTAQRQSSHGNIISPQNSWGPGMPPQQYTELPINGHGMNSQGPFQPTVPHLNIPPHNPSPVQFSTGPYSSSPQAHYGPGPPSQLPQSLPPQGTFNHDGNPQGNGFYSGNPQPVVQYPVIPPHGYQPPRQDSGYFSAGGSSSSGPEPYNNGFSQAYPQQDPSHQGTMHRGPSHQISNQQVHVQQGPMIQTASAQPDSLQNLNGQSNGKLIQTSEKLNNDTNQGQGDEQELSPLSREELGVSDLSNKSKKRKASPERQPNDGGTAVRRKARRQAPDVAPAYSRRW